MNVFYYKTYFYFADCKMLKEEVNKMLMPIRAAILTEKGGAT